MSKKVTILMSDEVYREVENFRRENPKEDGSVQSRCWAVETLLRMGLAAKKEAEGAQK